MTLSQQSNVVSELAENTKSLIPPTCTRCTLTITSGHAYELGGDRWHTQCFSCYKCDKELTCESDFLVLGTGSLICFACSDSCKGCGRKIDDLAIILSSSNKAYCLECFKCCKCNKNINDLRYAKTRKGLFCIACHEHLVAKSKNAEKKRRLQKELPVLPTQGSLSKFSSSSDTAVQKHGERNISPPRNLNGQQYSDASKKETNFKTESSEQLTQGSRLPSEVDDKEKHFDHAQNLHTDEPLICNKILKSSLKPVQNADKPLIKSNSWSVISQILKDGLDDQENLNTNESSNFTTAQNSVHNKEENGPNIIMSSSKSGERISDFAFVNSFEIQPGKAALDSKNFSVCKTPNFYHSRQYSVSDMLQRSFKNEQDSPSFLNELYFSPKNEKSRIFPFDKTPLRNKDDPSGGKSPVIHRRGLIISGSSESISDVIRSPPTSVRSLNSKKNFNLLYNSNPSQIPKLDSDSGRTGKHLNPSILSEVDEQISHEINGNQNNMQPSFSSYTLDPRLGTNSPNASETTNNIKGITKLARSVSVKSKVASLIHGKKNSSTKNTPELAVAETHTGWGVQPEGQQQKYHDYRNFGNSSSKKKSIPHGRGRSDSTIYSQLSPKGSNEFTFDHQRSHSGAITTPGVAVHVTPSLNIQQSPLFSKDMVLEDNEDANTPTNDDFIKRDFINKGLVLRQLKVEISDLRHTKSQLLNNIDQLKKTKEQLQYQVDMLKLEKKDLKPTSEEIVDVQEAEKHMVTLTHSSNKPRFWKIFGSKSMQFTNSNSATSCSSHNGILGTPSIEVISHPVLQNKNEFEDWNLKPAKNGYILFGSTLENRVQYEGNDIPMIITSCIRHIQSSMEFLTSEGIYRKSGSQLLIEQIEFEFQKWIPKEPISERLTELLNQDVHAVSSVLKRYLRKLQKPIFTFQIYEPLIQLIRDEKLCFKLSLKNSRNSPIYPNVLNKLVFLIKMLPSEHIKVLRVICSHVNLIATYQDINLMNVYNLSLVFAPGMIRDHSGEKDISDMKERNYLIGFVFSNYEDIFANL